MDPQHRPWLSFLQRVLLILLAAGLTWFMMQQMPNFMDPEASESFDVSKFRSKFPKVELAGKENIAAAEMYMDPDSLSGGFQDIIGLDDTCKLLKALLDPKLKRKPGGVILHGPPGTGKTLLARAVAKDSAIPFYVCSPESIEDKYVGESGRRLRALFSLAEKTAPSVVFVDEIDGFAGTRNSLDQSHVTQLKTIFLTALDGLVSRGRVTVIAATNRLAAVDPAVKRRLRLWVEVKLPSEETLARILEKEGAQPAAARDLAPELFKSGFSGSDAAQLCALACVEAAAKGLEFDTLTTDLLQGARARLGA